MNDTTIANPPTPLETLHHRLTVVRDRVRGVALGHHTGFYLFGRPGTCKTHTVKTTLDELDCKYEYFDGHLTQMGLFDLLALHHDRVIVLDDVSQLFSEKRLIRLKRARGLRNGGHADSDWSYVNRSSQKEPACRPNNGCIRSFSFKATG